MSKVDRQARDNELADRDTELRHQIENLKYERDSITNPKTIEDFNKQIDKKKDERSKVNEELEILAGEL